MFGSLIEEKCVYLYGKQKGKETAREIGGAVNAYKKRIVCKKGSRWNEKDIALITYPDSFQEKNLSSLKVLNKFLKRYVKDNFSIVHILPFAPFSSDRGFSVIDHYQVKKEFGDWSDIKNISTKYRLMSDMVLNHVSVKSMWFQKFLRGDPKYENYFIWFKKQDIPHQDLKKVIRSRTTPLLTKFKTEKGVRYVWTTYSVGNFTDQVDLNYHNPKVLIEVVKIFLNYLEKGVRIFRFDAVSGVWKELGTSCRHLPQTHKIISLFRIILDELCPIALLITETTTANFEENSAYLGKKSSGSNMTYNFTLAPLIIQAFSMGRSIHLNKLAEKMNSIPSSATFFNILDIHDGINIHSARNFLNDDEISNLLEEIRKRNGKFTYKLAPNGKKVEKEMCITWWSALSKNGDESFEIQLRKFLTSRAIAMSLKGVPAIYYLSLFGAKSDLEAFKKTKHPRDVNRSNLSYSKIENLLSKKDSSEYKTIKTLLEIIRKRKSIKAFHPDAKQEVLSLDPRVFTVVRGDGKNKVIALHNLSNVKINLKYKGMEISLKPYSFLWKQF